jgi:ATP phosphoribosyltransferase
VELHQKGVAVEQGHAHDGFVGEAAVLDQGADDGELELLELRFFECKKCRR